MKESLSIGFMFIVLVFVSGCDKCELFGSEMAGKIKEIQNSDKEIIGKNSYDCEGALKKSWYREDYFSAGEKREYNYTYNSKGLLIEKKGYEPGIMYLSSYIGAMGKDVDYTYEYDSEERITKIRVDFNYDGGMDFDYSQQTTFEYPEELVVVGATTVLNPIANSITSYVEYRFNSNGNIEKTIGYYMTSATEKIITNETLFTYDSNHSPYTVEPAPKSINNKLTKTISLYSYDENDNQGIADVSVCKYEYTYTVDGYPESQIENYSNGTRIINYYTYE